MEFRLSPGGAITGELRVPGDKSISHRAVMLGAIAEGTTQVSGFLQGEDALATVAAFRALGVDIEGPRGGALTVHGVGLHGLRAAQDPDAASVDGSSQPSATPRSQRSSVAAAADAELASLTAQERVAKLWAADRGTKKASGAFLARRQKKAAALDPMSAEMARQAADAFELLDEDGSGGLSPAEIRQVHSHICPLPILPHISARAPLESSHARRSGRPRRSSAPAWARQRWRARWRRCWR